MIDEEIDEMSDLENLFHLRDSDVDETFYFNDIVIYPSNDTNKTTVIFKYSFSNETDFESLLHIDNLINYNHLPILFCIGMCILPWYWMGFATKNIVIAIETHKLFEIDNYMVNFWEDFYNNILLEFIYLNRVNFYKINLTYDNKSSSKPNTEFMDINDNVGVNRSNNINNSVLIPLGGINIIHLFMI